jgi:hypothetical protein
MNVTTLSTVINETLVNSWVKYGGWANVTQEIYQELDVLGIKYEC